MRKHNVHVVVRGQAGAGKSVIMGIIQKALIENGINPVIDSVDYASDSDVWPVDRPMPDLNRFNVTITEQQTMRTPSEKTA